jgi:hypothetical protein
MTTATVRAGRAEAVARIRWAAWFGDRDLDLPLPPGWEVTHCPPAGGPDIGEDGIAAAFAGPIGTPTVRELARGRRRPCIVVDDLSRPTPAHRLVPAILGELAGAGIDAGDVTVLGGVANHRQMLREDFVKKVGEEVVRRCRVRTHFSWDGCVHVGTTSRGTPVSLNEHFVEADLKILVGSIVPHPVAGFAGGAKLVVPGVAGIDTATAFHGPDGPATGLADVDVPARLDVEEAARMAGVDCIVNVVPNQERGIAALVVGDLVEAHRAGVAAARRVFATPTPAGVDVCVLSAYPKDTEFLQQQLALNLWRSAPEPICHDGGTVVVASAGSEGAGFHSLAGPGMRLPASPHLRAPVAPCDLLFYCPGMNRADLPAEAGDVGLATSWADAAARLGRKHGDHARVAVFPCAAMQLAEAAC